MKNFRWWPAFGLTAVAVAAALTGCGSGNSSSDASVRVANATLTHPSLDLLVNASAAVSATTTDTVSTYVSPASGSVTLQLNDNGGSTALSTTVPTLTGGNHYTLVAYESGGNVKTALLGEDAALPAAGVTTLRIYDAAVEAGKLDVYVTSGACTTANLSTLSPTTSFPALTAPAAASLTQGSGSWNVCVTGSGSKTDLRMALPVVLTSASVATVLLTPASGGALLNGSMLVQQGAYTAARNTNTRVRLAAAVSGGTTVSATASSGTTSVTIDSGSASPAFGFYALVPSGSSLNIVAAGQTVAAPPTTALVAGGDATLLVYGAAASPTASIIADDNRQPTDATTTKLRLINGVTGNSGTLTLTGNNSPVGINVAPGTASAYALTLVNSSTNAMSLVLTSSTGGTPSLLNTTLSANATYSILAGDPVSGSTAPQLLIR